jgi:hypothetical protein
MWLKVAAFVAALAGSMPSAHADGAGRAAEDARVTSRSVPPTAALQVTSDTSDIGDSPADAGARPEKWAVTVRWQSEAVDLMAASNVDVWFPRLAIVEHVSGFCSSRDGFPLLDTLRMAWLNGAPPSEITVHTSGSAKTSITADGVVFFETRKAASAPFGTVIPIAPLHIETAPARVVRFIPTWNGEPSPPGDSPGGACSLSVAGRYIP